MDERHYHNGICHVGGLFNLSIHQVASDTLRVRRTRTNGRRSIYTHNSMIDIFQHTKVICMAVDLIQTIHGLLCQSNNSY